MRPVSLSNLATPFERGVRTVVVHHRSLSAPVTDLLAVVVCAVYAAQAFQTVRWGAPSVFVATNYAYLSVPLLAWPLSPLLHGGLVHVVPNLLTLLAFGRIVEAHLTTHRFAAMAAVAAVASIAALAGWGLVFGSRPYVAAYGISGVVFAAGGFAVVHFPAHEQVTDLELLAVLFGVCAVALTGVESVGAAVSLSPAGVNVGHVMGLAVGLGTAALAGDCADVTVVEPSPDAGPDPVSPSESTGADGSPSASDGGGHHPRSDSDGPTQRSDSDREWPGGGSE